MVSIQGEGEKERERLPPLRRADQVPGLAPEEAPSVYLPKES